MKKIVSGIILLLYCILGMVPMAWADAPPQKIMLITVDNAVSYTHLTLPTILLV